MMAHFKCALVLLAIALPSALSVPALWVARHNPTCTQHPDQGFKGHQAPQKDAAIGIKVDGKVCPGGSAKVTVSFGSDFRRSLVTLTAGSWVGGSDATCPGRSVNMDVSDTWTGTVAIPCDTTASSTKIFVTSASGAISPYFQAESDVKFATDCNLCGGAPTQPASPVASPTPSPAAKPTPSPAAKPTPSPAAKPTPSPAAKPTPSPAAKPTPSPAAKPTPSPAVAMPSPAMAKPSPTVAKPSPAVAKPSPAMGSPKGSPGKSPSGSPRRTGSPRRVSKPAP